MRMFSLIPVQVFCLIFHCAFYHRYEARNAFSFTNPVQKQNVQRPVGHLWITTLAPYSLHASYEFTENTKESSRGTIGTNNSQNSNFIVNTESINNNDMELTSPMSAMTRVKPERQPVSSLLTEQDRANNTERQFPVPDDTFNNTTSATIFNINRSASTVFGESDIRQELQSIQVNNSYPGLASSCSAEPDERLCGCSSACNQLNNCCYDSQFVGSLSDSGNRQSCYQDFNNKWTLSAPNLLIDKCLQDWSDESTRQLCENSNTEDFRNYVPCYSQRSGLTYKNVFCLRCNSLTECFPWEVTFQSIRALEFSSIETYTKMKAIPGRPLLSSRGQQFVVTPLPGTEPSHCAPAVVDRCTEEFTTEALTKLCKAYYSPVFTDSVVYRNLHCFQCFMGKSMVATGSVKSKSIRGALSIVLDVTDFIKPDTKKCVRESCVPPIRKVRGYFQSLNIYMLTNKTNMNPGAPMLNSTAIKMLTTNWKNTLRDRLTSSPGNLLVTLYMMQQKEKVILQHRYLFKTWVTVENEIFFENITFIKNAISSVSFELNVYDGFNVSCCFDKNGKKLSDLENTARNTNLSGEKNETSVSSGVNTSRCSFPTIPYPLLAVFVFCVIILEHL